MHLEVHTVEFALFHEAGRPVYILICVHWI